MSTVLETIDKGTLYLEKRGSDWRIADFLFSDAESEPIRLTDILKEAGF